MKNHNHCPVCQSEKLETIEKVSTQNIAHAWAKVEPSAGQILLNCLRENTIPSTIQMDKCSGCGLEFANTMFTANDEWYSACEQYGLRWEFNQCLKDLPAKGSTILEIGCGEGYFLELATRVGHKVVGVDFNRRAIEVAKNKGLEAYTYNLRDLKNHIDTKFDTVVFFHVIEHLDDLEAFFEDLGEIMHSGSTLHFSCPSPRRLTTHLEPHKRVGLRDFWDYPPHHQSRWNREAAAQLLSRFNWTLEKYLEEPLDWRGVSSWLVAQDLAETNLKLSDLPSFERKKRLLIKMLQVLIPSFKHSGMSMYCSAKRQPF
ncbi:MAG: class I SAM-dependent methyltransferase [Potamolinea sp.]